VTKFKFNTLNAKELIKFI